VSADGSSATPSAVGQRGRPRRVREDDDRAPRISPRESLRRRRHRAAVRTRHALARFWPVTKAVASQAWGDRIFGLAAEAGFWALLSLTPLLLVLVGAVGYLTPLFGSHIVVEVEQKILRAAGHFLAPQAVDNVLKPVLTDVVQHGRGGIISISFLLALWTGSTAMNTYVNTISISYGMRHVRSAVRARVVAFVLYLGALVAGAVALPLLITAPEWVVHLVPHPIWAVAKPFVDVAYWPIIVVACTGLLATLYHVATPVRGKWRRDLPGAIAGMVIWLASVFGLRAYLAYAIGHSPTYGALSSPVAALLFLYFTALAVLLGAEINAQIAGCRHDQPAEDELDLHQPVTLVLWLNRPTRPSRFPARPRAPVRGPAPAP
jgi:membrane protein